MRSVLARTGDLRPDTATHTPRGHDLSLLQEMQELTPAQRIRRNCEMAGWVEKLQIATHHATRSDLPKPG
jgi:hypothetical protein